MRVVSPQSAENSIPTGIPSYGNAVRRGYRLTKVKALSRHPSHVYSCAGMAAGAEILTCQRSSICLSRNGSRICSR
jgi:hypothetical protein